MKLFTSLSRLVGVVSGLFFCTSLSAALPADAQALLEKLPGNKVTLDLVLARAMESSDTFKVVQAQYPQILLPTLEAQAPFDFVLTAEVGALDNQNEPTFQFAPSRTTGFKTGLGLAKAFPTGTSLLLELTNQKSDITVGAFGNTLAYEPKAKLSISQDLLQNSFGYGARRMLAAGRLMTQAKEAEFREGIQDWAFATAAIFYEAWSAQAAVATAHQTVLRRKKLLGITERKVARGTAEKPDLLQVKSAVLEDQIREKQAVLLLGDKWRSLIIALKLKKDWLNLNPEEIPMGLDEPVSGAMEACGSEAGLKPAPTSNYKVDSAKAASEAANLSFEQAKNAALPSLQLVANVSNNAVDPADNGDALNEFLDLAHPGWEVGVKFRLPFGNSAAEARARSGIANKMLAEARAAVESDSLAMDWMNQCLDLHRLQKAYHMRQQAFANQRERAQLDHNRFAIGRIPTLTVVQSDDSAALAEAELHKSEVERRLAAWKVRKLSAQIQPYLLNIKDKLKNVALE